jgi:hypothetical protein
VNSAGLTPGFYSGVVRLAAAPGAGPLIGDASCIRVNAWVLPADNDVPDSPLPFPQQPEKVLYLPLARK